MTPTNEAAERLRSFFLERGWSIQMEDNETAVLDPFIEVACRIPDPNDDEHWHRGPSASCSICRFGAASEAAPSPDPRLCVCGRLIVSMPGALDYCVGCGQATCSCVIRPPVLAPSLLQERDRLAICGCACGCCSIMHPAPKFSATPTAEEPIGHPYEKEGGWDGERLQLENDDD